MADSPHITFACVLEGDGSAIPIAFDQRALFGKARPPVTVTINGHRYRSTVAIMNGVTFVPLRASHRGAAGVRPGDTVEVTLALDTAPRDVEPPETLADALAKADVRDAWNGLSFTARREDAEAVEDAKRPDTRARRIEAIVARLKG